MRSKLVLSLLMLASLTSAPLVERTGAQQAPAPPAPAAPRLKALVVSGGCCHDYTGQNKILVESVRKAIPTVDWMIAYQGGTGTNARIPLYSDPDWFKGYDIIVHNECYADVADEAFIRGITAAHQAGIPSMVLHCSMHSYRSAKIDDWRELMGVTTRRHTKAHQIAVKIAAPDDPVVRGLKADWVTPTDELYVIDKVWPNVRALATAVSPEAGNPEFPVVWVNDYHGARVFGTTLGHGETWNDPVFQELLVRGFKWALKRDPEK